ncbi:54S ribosomal protein L4 mitochondrial [Recurvomyces mirabilis]|uniref:Large ribosomal subunit protein uL29m n=1 Tax=Recurvomyces mirabilis TaxID=574656 RepID=A0AAE0WHV0_9PEZI|nr:54S ribosomal protein L4 mitochondrial [Recurvomyces mirabilis]KAK5150772.1 54S ribosomal protein L4 mitochondrial [Recurvomyces mirabilis]
MASIHCSSASLLRSVFTTTTTRASVLPPAFLVPAFNITQTSSFSSTTPAQARKDGNRNRGVSALRHTGIGRKQKLGVSLANLPKPVLDPQKRSTVDVDEDHGLWDFFYPSRELFPTPEESHAHGRAWTVPELRVKDWDDLHRLWWTCVKENNRSATAMLARQKAAARSGMYGDYEANARHEVVAETMKKIKFVLTERWYAWENARMSAMEDEEVDLYADVEKGEEAYLPGRAGDEPLALGTKADALTDSGKAIPPPDAAGTTREARL